MIREDVTDMRSKRSAARTLAAMTVAALAASLGWPAPALAAKCEPAGADATPIADARAAIDATCDCTGSPTHGTYVKCASGVILGRIVALQLNPACKGTVQRCAAKSTCGKPGAVVCCKTNSKGVTKSAIASDPGHCKPPAGGSACASTFTSACDACVPGGCAIGTVSFANHVQPIFTDRCTTSGCHSGDFPAQGMLLTAGASYANIVNVPNLEVPGLDRVEPGDTANSYLWMKVTGAPGISGGRMPLFGGPLTSSEIGLITGWIQQGAADN